jgi:Ca2+-transporting ATPase
MGAEYQQTAEDVSRGLPSDAAQGLTSVDSRARLARDGLNELAVQAPVPAWKTFVAQFGDILVMLLIATAMSFALWLYERASRCRTKRSRSARSCS